MIPLKNGYATEDPRLDRIPRFDERSRNFKIAETVGAKKQRSYTWSCSQHLDQKQDGACVGFDFAHELIARPAVVKGIDAKFAKEKIYWPAQENDDWPGGSYPGAKPFYEGTSVLAGLKQVIKLGYATGYVWGFGLNDLVIGVGYSGPANLGINFYRGMMNPDKNGFIHPTGEIAGGHCILCKGVNLKKKYFKLHNSWGTDWGMAGDCFVSFDDMERLLYEEGEAAFFTGRKVL
jgi:hypothetical protein